MQTLSWTAAGAAFTFTYADTLDGGRNGAAIRIDARDRSIVCVGDPDRAVPDREGDRPSAHEHVAHDPGALRVDHSDRVGRNRRLSM